MIFLQAVENFFVVIDELQSPTLLYLVFLFIGAQTKGNSLVDECCNYLFTITAESSCALIGSFLLSISGQTHEIYNLCDIDATSESRKFEKSICHFLTNRKRPFFPLANKGARRIMNLVASD